MQGYIIPNLGKANSRACTFAVARVMEKCGITAVMPEAMQREFPIRSVLFQPKEQGLKNSDFIIDRRCFNRRCSSFRFIFPAPS